MVHAIISETFLKLIVILLAAKLGGFIFEKLKQPAVLGELIIGLILGPSVLHFISPEANEIILFAAEVGVIILLFEVGLESNVNEFLKVGVDSLMVAFLGVVVPLGLGVAFFLWLKTSWMLAFFVGATLTATSVGITMRVMADLNKAHTKEGKIILGAAVIDDILGLILLSIVIGMSEGTLSAFSIGKTVVISVVFIVGATYIGIKFLPTIFKIVHSLKMRRTFIISAGIFAMTMAFIADRIGLATIVGSFAAGLVLESTEHKEHILERIKPLSDLFVPIFFVLAGSYMMLSSMLSGKMFLLIVCLFVIAIVGKIVAGLGVIKSKVSRLNVGVGMIPRGEVGLIFAAVGISSGIVTQSLYSAIVTVVMLTTFVTPPLLKYLLERDDKKGSGKKKSKA